MPKLLPLAPSHKAAMRAQYAAGRTPHEIAKEMERKKVAITHRQISNLAQREGWKQDQVAVAEACQEDARAIIAKVRASGARDLEEALGMVAEGLKIDAQQLRDAWHLVNDAAGASSLMRAKTQHLNRVLTFHDLDKPEPPPTTVNLLAAIYTRPIQRGPDGTEITVEEVGGDDDAETAGPDKPVDLDFAE